MRPFRKQNITPYIYVLRRICTSIIQHIILPEEGGSAPWWIVLRKRQWRRGVFAVHQPHSGHWPGSMIYRSCGPLEHARFLEPSMDVRKKCAPGSTHDV